MNPRRFVLGLLLALLPSPTVCQPSQPVLSSVKHGGKEGYIDPAGLVVILFKFDYAEDFYKGIAKVQVKGKTGYINTAGEMVIPPQYAQ